MAWYHINLRNQWTRANPGYEDADLGAWQVGLAACGQFTMVGVFDHVIESSSRIRNFSQGMDLVWADVLALGNGFGFLHNGQGTTVELSAGSVLDHFGRWGRTPMMLRLDDFLAANASGPGLVEPPVEPCQ